MFYTKHKSYKFGSQFDLHQTMIDRLIKLFNFKDQNKSETILAGRNSVSKITVPELGSLIVKQYARGGLVAYFNKDRYFYSKQSRSELEFNALINAASAGVNVPQPIAFASKGSLFYKAWLITKKIEHSKNFIELCLNEKSRAVNLLPAICENIKKLIKNSIHHKDLHPGNIIIDQFNKPFILDFDKACYYSGGRDKLSKKYRKRWQRAVKKYNLPEELLQIQL